MENKHLINSRLLEEGNFNGLFKMWDEKEPDERILWVSIRDPFWNYIKLLSDVPLNLLKEIERFFSIYKELDKRRPGWRAWKTTDQR